MKARFMTKTALSALALAFAGALPGVAQQTASPAAVPAVNKVKASAVEKAFMNQMAGVVQASLKAGAAIDVVAGATTIRYRATDVLRVNKHDFDPEAVFARTGPERLHVVTCGGRYDRAAGGYEDNVIVVAVPVTGR